MGVPGVEEQVESGEIFVAMVRRGGQSIEDLPGGLGLIMLELPEQLADEWIFSWLLHYYIIVPLRAVQVYKR